MFFRVGLVATATLLAIFPIPSSVIEYVYSRHIYIFIQKLVTPLTSMVQVAIFDVFVVSMFVVGVAIFWMAARRQGSRGRLVQFVHHLFNLAVFLSGLYILFLFFWGFNYSREPLTEKLDYDPSHVTHESLLELASQTVDQVNVLYRSREDKKWPALDELSGRLAAAFYSVQDDLGNPNRAVITKPKRTIFLPYFRQAGVDGMISPFSLEILINDQILAFERPYVVAHEWGHLAGFADESEASFVGWLICLAGDDLSRYSAWLALFPRLIRHLDQEEKTELWASLDEGPTDDLREVAERLRSSVPIVRRSANRVYDQYLKANRVEQGISSYDAVVDLILGSQAWK